jgi:hypothetical protein
LHSKKTKNKKHTKKPNLKTKLHYKYIILGLLILFSFQGISQNNLGLQFFGLAIHPKGDPLNAHLMPFKLDKEARFVVNFGVVASYDHFVYKDIVSIKFAQTFFADCATKFAGVSHVGFRVRVLKIGKHLVQLGIGPTYMFRQNWYDLDGYVQTHPINGEPGDKYQTKFIWYGGEIEYKYSLTDFFDISAGFIPHYNIVMSTYLGINYKFKKK